MNRGGLTKLVPAIHLLGWILLCTGCSQSGAPQTPPSASAPPGTERRDAAKMLAYEHEFLIETEAEKLRASFERTQNACAAATAYDCTLIAAELTEGDASRARLVARIEPKGVADLLRAASADGRVDSQKTSAEDLTQPVTDTGRHLAWLTRHRDQLMSFQNRRDITVEQLIALSEQIARAQGEIEALSAQQSHLQKRLDTDLVTIAWYTPAGVGQGLWQPLRDAGADFFPNLVWAFAALVQFVSVVLPWALILVPAILGVRYLVRWWRARRPPA